MNIVLCGANGQLGRALSEILDDHDVLAIDMAALDITNFVATTELIRARRPDLVINCAAYTQVDAAEEDVANAYRVNALGPRNLAIASAAVDSTLLHVSTDYVFDGTAGRPYHEYDTPCPASVYGASKLAGELAVASLNPKHYIARTAWLYDAFSNNFPNTMLKLSTRAEVRVVNDQRGSPTYAPHLAQALVELMTTAAYGVWHLAGSGATTWYGLTQHLFASLDIETAVVPVSTEEFPRPAARPANSVLESLQSPQIELPPWEQGLQAFVEARRGLA